MNKGTQQTMDDKLGWKDGSENQKVKEAMTLKGVAVPTYP